MLTRFDYLCAAVSGCRCSRRCGGDQLRSARMHLARARRDQRRATPPNYPNFQGGPGAGPPERLLRFRRTVCNPPRPCPWIG
jgi:hypothetical protein